MGAANATARAKVQAAAKGGSVGDEGSGCVLPVSFDIAAKWKPKAVKGNSTLEVTQQANVTLTCEIDAKPAGNIGFIRVWVGGSADDDPRETLEAFVEKEAEDPDEAVFIQTKAGPYSAVEADYLSTNEFLNEPKKERALAFTTPKGVVLLHLGGLDSKEHKKMLPAYELARTSVRAK
ncbi:hypothetical protein AQ490_13885 [Wenjunlia vitaminophila]|uniref:Uncharacterized protein n=1 Tax=Wenjunlia vitaminophila TaxID=76728 RepID=A0A0T6LW12_WENVI|nr:lipoprotein [Wenjunlia vitaminophila]KRV50208.1 hypothetical protein AQ490_13885 [Wenjunlia vitaminophila]